MRTYLVFNARGQHIGSVQAADKQQALIAAKEHTAAPMVELVLTVEEARQLVYVEQERMFGYRHAETWQ
jgi:soluble cytochrome b562